ncbi:hypothetical protein Pcinc_037916 [Petrolisthes cinctipes]|uniref:Uncharacterized protein n=1 Tax=Petrolisthes cinctipes TaxID=88211 RepID=A0AAE1BVJ1_PETCI|nr:hypothetical protein Pcinc_037916 [Petrolisthes cinctipes]
MKKWTVTDDTSRREQKLEQFLVVILQRLTELFSLTQTPDTWGCWHVGMDCGVRVWGWGSGVGFGCGAGVRVWGSGVGLGLGCGAGVRVWGWGSGVGLGLGCGAGVRVWD